ncbi:hypothetical protein LXA43DRAFT_1000352 [Ganoderma leucocontextum]|nr:hypothetical protein LXA43DRAFT_1000352 [Ganoderma leucocontextum]
MALASLDISDDNPPAFIAGDWIGKNKIYDSTTLPLYVLQARTDAFAIPEDVQAALLPLPTLPVIDFIDQSLPTKDPPTLLGIKPKEWFSMHGPTHGALEILRHRPLPHVDVLRSLEEQAGQLWLDGMQSSGRKPPSCLMPNWSGRRAVHGSHPPLEPTLEWEDQRRARPCNRAHTTPARFGSVTSTGAMVFVAGTSTLLHRFERGVRAKQYVRMVFPAFINSNHWIVFHVDTKNLILPIAESLRDTGIAPNPNASRVPQWRRTRSQTPMHVRYLRLALLHMPCLGNRFLAPKRDAVHVHVRNALLVNRV